MDRFVSSDVKHHARDSREAGWPRGWPLRGRLGLQVKLAAKRFDRSFHARDALLSGSVLMGLLADIRVIVSGAKHAINLLGLLGGRREDGHPVAFEL